MLRTSHVLAALTAACLAVPAARHVSAQTAPIPDGITFTPAFGTDGANLFSLPALMVEVPGKPGTFLVPEMATGKIWILAPGANGFTKTLFGQVQGLATENDMGLVGFAFHPDYVNNRKYYVKHGNPQRPPRQMFIEERIAAADYLHDSGQPARRLMTVDLPNEYNDHNGGNPVFGPDGYLYLSFGDGGWDLITADSHKNGQNREVLLGKMLRIDVDHKDPGLEYAIPKDNPFVTDANPNVRREIWAYGLRNSYRFAFDRLTGELYDGDIGWIKFDEVDIVKKGANYGWSLKEGSYCLPDGPCTGVTTPIEEPLASLVNGGAPGQAKCLIGGQVYRGDPASPFYGVYLFGDYTLKKLFALRKPASGPATVKEYNLVTPQEPLAFTLDAMNNIYMVCYSGTIYKLNHAQLIAKATTTAIRTGSPSGPMAGAGKGLRSRIALIENGRWVLPAGLSGDWEAIAPDGIRLGRLAPDGTLRSSASAVSTRTAPGSSGGIVLLRPIGNP
jgi:glucose/arabinose dehydrogenase